MLVRLLLGFLSVLIPVFGSAQSPGLLTQETLSMGQWPGVTSIRMFGQNASVSSSSETVWGPGATYARLSSAVAFEAVSSSADDAAAGTGARTISVKLIDGSYVETTVTVTMNGTTAVAIPGTFLASNGARVVTAGSGLVNAGAIDIRTVSGSVIKRQIKASSGIDSDFLYTVPAGYRALLRTIPLTSYGAGGALSSSILLHDESGIMRIAAQAGISLQGLGIQKGDLTINLPGGGIAIEEKTLVELRAITSTGAGDLTANSELLLYKKDPF